MTPEQHVLRWEELHGVPASALVRRWLRLVLLLSRPLAVPAWSVTLAGVAVTLAALVLPLWAAALCVLLAGLLDGVDGCVAVLRGTASDAGRRLDHAADRLGEVVFAALLWRAGAPVWLALLALVLMLGVEAVRRGPVVTVAERPVRVLFTAAALLVWPLVWAWGLVGLSAFAVGALVLRS